MIDRNKERKIQQQEEKEIEGGESRGEPSSESS